MTAFSDESYDLKNDPCEMRNLSVDSAVQRFSPV